MSGTVINMGCSICGKNGHNARSCPSKNIDESSFALWVKFDGLTEMEATDLLHDIMKDKARVAPKSRGTFAKAKKKDLPVEIRHILKLEDDNDKEKK